MTLLELNYQRRKAKAKAAGMLDTAVAETRALTIAEHVHFDALTARIQDLDDATAEREMLRELVD